MVLITEHLIRKRAEHNDLEISTLEEVSLHQQDIERIEHIDRWCRELRILYLQSNLIPKIENVGRLKKLEYLNLALNNVEKIENLSGCESLQKLDLTVNFIGELTSVEHLKDLVHFRELYLTGNPCTEYEGYREYVIVTLPQLKMLDGQAVDKSERIRATQDYSELRNKIIQQQEEYRKKRERQKNDAKIKEEKKNVQKEKKPGFDGRWYTDINEGDKKTAQDNASDEDSEDFDKIAEKDKQFWEEKTEFTPESRIEVHKQMQEQKARDNKEEKEVKPPRRLFTDDGRPLNVNEPKVDFSLIEDEDKNQYILDLAVFKHMNTSLVDVDVQTNYVRVVLKGKTFQLCMVEDINADSSTAKRSQVTGHLLITMPKAKPLLKPKKIAVDAEENKENKAKQFRKTHEKLEVDKKAHKTVDIANIVPNKTDKIVPPLGTKMKHPVKERPNSEDFIDNLDVPPLE